MAVFHQINLVCHDLDATIAFYRMVGLDIPEDAAWRTASGPHHVRLGAAGTVDLDADSHALARAYNSGFSAERGRVVIGVHLDDSEAVDALWENLLAQGVQGLQAPFDAFWGARYAIVEDPDGNPVGLMSPTDPAKRSPPPDV
jgi:uncharacterized glyoxalase superfamily protein PhnB